MNPNPYTLCFSCQDTYHEDEYHRCNMNYKHPYDNNFTVYKVYPNTTDGSSAKEKRHEVVAWLDTLPSTIFHKVDPVIRYDKKRGCYRVMVNEARVRDTGYTQLLWFKDSPKNVGYIYLPLGG